MYLYSIYTLMKVIKHTDIEAEQLNNFELRTKGRMDYAKFWSCDSVESMIQNSHFLHRLLFIFIQDLF